ncbi:MAG: M3 family oligoendopeptidase [Candidatus Levybacteria bacterium]|nr:M3 family oligoendopeptidase [Candidatus Levybacteria bacterium]
MTKLNIKHTSWNLKPLFQSNNDPAIAQNREAVEKANKKFVSKWSKREDYLSDPKVLKTALDEYEKLLRNFGTDGNEGYYFWLRSQQDQNDQAIKAKFAKVLDFSTKLQNELQFFELRLAKVAKAKQKVFLKDPQLKPYKHYLEKIFRQADYLLSEAEEKIMNLKSDPAHMKWEQMLSGFLSKQEREVLTESGKKEKMNFEQLISLVSSKKKKVRDEAADAVNDIFAQLVETAEAEINAILANKKIDDEIRRMPRPDFSRHLADDMESDVVDALVQTVSKRYKIAQKYYQFKAKLMGVPKLAYHERSVPFGKIDKTYSFADGAALVHKVFTDLDQEFSDALERFLENGQIDVYPSKGKRGGAFCVYWQVDQPTYVMLNYTDKLRDVETLAHEMGHGINDELMKGQNALNFGTPTSTAEVASTFMEDFVLQEILKTADEETKFGIMVSKLDSEIATIFRQIACYQFEAELHKAFREKGYLSHQEIGKIFQKHMAAYMGPGVEQSKGSENWWVYWSHIRAFFYVYSYASGLLISKSMQNGVKADPKFIGKVKEFLSAGTSVSPKDIFKNLGIDITDTAFWNKGLDEVEKLLKDTEKLAKKMGKF